MDLTMMATHTIPFIFIAGYMMYPTQLRINATALYYLSVLHNSALIAMSAWAVISLGQIAYEDGLAIESMYYFKNPKFDRIIFWVYMSKYYEFGDTFLLYLNGRKPIFLQKFHHIGAVICWHLSYYYKVDAVGMSSLLNCFVHTIMYTYYLGSLLKIKQVKLIKPYITGMQISQFIMGLSCAYQYRPPVETAFNHVIVMICAAYTTCVLLLFGQFYYVTYIAVKDRKKV